MNWNNIKNVVFDLGNVIINIDFALTTKAFADLAGADYEEMHQKFVQYDVYDEYEKGIIDDAGFRDFMKKNLNFSASDQQIDDAWNALLLELPKERVEAVRRVGESRRTFILSNTSNIHILECNNILKASSGVNDIRDIVNDKAYLSFEIGMRKPGHEIYKFILNDSGLKAEETVFIDDNEENIKGATEVGIQAIYLKHPDDLIKILP